MLLLGAYEELCCFNKRSEVNVVCLCTVDILLVEKLSEETQRQISRKDFPGKDKLVDYFKGSLQRLEGLKETQGLSREEALNLIPESRQR